VVVHPPSTGLRSPSRPTWPPDEGNGATLLKKALTWLAVAFVVFYVIQRPEDAAGIVRSAGAALSDAAASLSAFMGSLV
jgi:hypothetical protein